MVGCPQSKKMLDHVWWRLFAARTAARWFRAFVVCAAAYGVLLLINRLTGLLPNVFEPWTLAIPPAAGLLLALVWPARPTSQDAARSVDQSQATRDLFLTLTMLDTTAGEYQPLVLRDAERVAPQVRPPQVVPFQWGRRAGVSAALLGLLAVGTLFLGQFDPFGKVSEAKELATQEKRLDDLKKINEIRKADLKQQDLEQDASPDVEKALEKLKLDLNSMRRNQPQENREKLAIDQKLLGDKFRATNEALKSLMNKTGLQQQFGSQNASEFKKWQQDLQQGSPGEMSKALEQLKEDLEALARTDNPVDRTEMERKIEKQLKALADFASERTGSKSLSAALERAKEQLEAVKAGKELSIDAMQAMQESLDVAQMELQQLAQSARDLKALEEALETLTMAKQLNQGEQLDGEMTDSATAMADYKAMYAEMLAEMGLGEGEGEGEGDGEGDGDGDGTGGDGMGRGGDPEEEDDSVETGFVPEQTKTHVQQGKILMSLKQKGLSESGEAQQEFRNLIQNVRQSYAEAIESEQIPPGYHEGIKTYFDSLGQQTPAP
ncbi:MAG: hypothetical protein KF774_11545 [Planctomyces sp.]|nr:hypothetical protein [Planctomyces sp.]